MQSVIDDKLREVGGPKLTRYIKDNNHKPNLKNINSINEVIWDESEFHFDL